MSEKQSNSLKIITIVAMMFLYAMISFVTNLAAPVGKIWGASFDDPAQAERMGMLGNLFNFLAYLIMGIPAGNFLSKYGYKKTALTAIFLGFVGICIQWLSGVFDSFAVYLGGALICGFCWETWNYCALAKWVYAVPWVHRFQIWEMPLIGFAGYLPFGVECAAVTAWICPALVDPAENG